LIRIYPNDDLVVAIMSNRKHHNPDIDTLGTSIGEIVLAPRAYSHQSRKLTHLAPQRFADDVTLRRARRKERHASAAATHQKGESMQIVNGYLCRDCTDVAKARRGVDPRPAEPARAPPERVVSEPGPAGALAANGDVGTRLHVIA
jgi:hypothetical protein